MKKVEIYTDGSCIGNPGPGGYAAILIYQGRERVIKGSHPDTTNNRMEMTAVIEALKALKEPCNLVIYSDSQYIVNAFNNNWILNWQQNGWRTSDKKPVTNQDLWEILLQSMGKHQITWSKVRGHASNPHNNRCDEIARGEAKRLVFT